MIGTRSPMEQNMNMDRNIYGFSICSDPQFAGK